MYSSIITGITTFQLEILSAESLEIKLFQSVSDIVVGEVLKQYTAAHANLLKHLSHLLVEILCISDPLQSDRLQLAVYSDKGLLDLVQACQKTDSSRAYQVKKNIFFKLFREKMCFRIVNNTYIGNAMVPVNLIDYFLKFLKV